MKKRIIGMFLAAAMVISMCACGGEKQEAEPTETPVGGSSNETSNANIKEDAYVLRLGVATGGQHPHNVWMEAFEKELEAATEGQIDVQLYPAGQLGNLAELVQGLRDGTVDSAMVPTTYFGTAYMGATVVDLPYLFEDSEQLYRILTQNDTLYTKGYEENGFIPVSYLRLFDRQVLSKKKITSIDDFSSMKLWSLPSAVIQKEVGELGATVSNIDMGELAPSLQNGTVDGTLTDISLFLSQSLYTSAPYMLEGLNDSMISLYAISPVWWNQIPEDLQGTIKETAQKVAEEVGYPYIDTMKETALDVMTEKGLEVVEADAVLEEELKSRLQSITDWYLESYPEYQPVYDELAALIEADK
ncbi:MAG: TRAP transporter substrate-binding protein [Eubacterium sp.]|nr:TRAP transporter substrate-binding protein [Eubacterium sp.]